MKLCCSYIGCPGYLPMCSSHTFNRLTAENKTTNGTISDAMAPSSHAQVFPTASFIPLVGLGTWTQNVAGEVENAVYTAIK